MAGRPRGIIKTGGRKKGTPNKKTAMEREATAEFFARIIDDEAEAGFWRWFVSGFQIVYGKVVPIPPNPVSFQAFKRAVEYKRGMPKEVIEHTGSGGGPVMHTIRFGNGREDADGL